MTVFIDEIDKLCGGGDGAAASRASENKGEGVQRELLTLVEGCAVQTRYGPIRTDFILFIASGAFHKKSPSDLLPELQVCWLGLLSLVSIMLVGRSCMAVAVAFTFALLRLRTRTLTGSCLHPFHRPR